MVSYLPPYPTYFAQHIHLIVIRGAYERREGASNYHTLFVPSFVKSRALNLAENAPL